MCDHLEVFKAEQFAGLSGYEYTKIRPTRQDQNWIAGNNGVQTLLAQSLRTT